MAYPTLNANEIFGALYNQIISQQVFADNIAGVPSVVEKARVDGGLLGDTKLFYATDALKSAAWGNDAEADNLLDLHRPAAPSCQAISIDQFRQIALTVDQYLSKRAWGTEGAFSQFNSVMLGWISETKKIYDATLYNAFLGTRVSSIGKQSISISLDAGSTEDGRRLRAEVIGQSLADLMVAMEDVSRSYNDYQYLRSYSEGDVKIVWNSKYLNELTKRDLPTVFHKDGLIEKMDLKMAPRYFGTVITASNVSGFSAASPTTGKPIDSDDKTYVPGTSNANGCIRSLIERDIKVSSTTTHVFPGDEIPAGTIIDTTAGEGTCAYSTVYIEDAKVICKVLVKFPPFMSAFEVGTSFFNPKSLTENHYLTWGHNSLAHLAGYPMITIKEA